MWQNFAFFTILPKVLALPERSAYSAPPSGETRVPCPFRDAPENPKVFRELYLKVWIRREGKKAGLELNFGLP